MVLKLEINSITPVYPVTKPEKIKDDEERPKKNPNQKNDEKDDETSESDSSQHIDEIV